MTPESLVRRLRLVHLDRVGRNLQVQVDESLWFGLSSDVDAVVDLADVIDRQREPARHEYTESHD